VVFALANLPWVESQNQISHSVGWLVEISVGRNTRPKLYKPIPFPEGNRSLVSLDTVNEPAYSGILKWLHKKGLPTLSSNLVDGPCVSEFHFVEFLRKAV